VLEAKNIHKEYRMPGGNLQVLSEIDFVLRNGESASIIGPSGSGKSTFLYILGALEPPTSGSVSLSGQDPYTLTQKDLAAFRNRKIGFVFQDHHLLPQCSVLENVLIPAYVAPEDGTALERAEDLLAKVGLSDRIHHKPYELSGGEKQRVALARALILDPELLLCDEPTGNLDGNSAETVVSLLMNLHEQLKNMLVVVTHDLDVANRFGPGYKLFNSRLRPA
jgi:lipoprotein-releasing system ATP-binding protein